MTKYISYILVFLLLISAWLCDHYKNKYDYLVSRLHEAELQSEIKKLNTQNEYSQKVISTKDHVKTEEDKVNEEFNRISSAVANDSLHNSEDGRSLSDTTSVTVRISENQDRQLTKCRATYYELEKEYLILARDRDIVITHYNALIDFYNGL